jgi:dihydroorotase-like cyclic amidohydrolase
MPERRTRAESGSASGSAVGIETWRRRVSTTSLRTEQVHGPIDFLLLEFPRRRLTGETGAALMSLIERGIIALYDLVVISKNADGSFEALEVGQIGELLGGFEGFAGARSCLMSDDDIAEAAGAMAPDTVAALVMYENTWATEFVAAARNSGGEVIASARIPAADVMAALDELESAAPAATGRR